MRSAVRFPMFLDLGRMLREQGAHLRRVVFGWLRSKDGHNRRFWATSGDDARALFEEFATIQHYVRGDEETFLKSLQRARCFRGSEAGNASRTGLLLDILEANQQFRNGKIAAAVAGYERRIQQEERNYRAMLRRRQRSDARCELPGQRQVLGLLELNLAELRRSTPTHSDKAERHYQQALIHMPASTFAHRCYAEFLVSQRRWEEAIEKFRKAYAEGGFDDTSSALNASLAWSYREWARWLNRPAESASAPEASDAAVSDLGRQRLMAFRKLFSRLVGKAARASVSSPPAPLRSSTLDGPSAALERLDEALRTLKWKNIPDWEAALNFDWASTLDQMIPEGAKDVSDAFLKSAQRFSDARDPASSASAFEQAGDVLVKRGLMKEAIAAYEDGLKKADGIKLEDDWQMRRKRDNVDKLLSKLAIILLSVAGQRAASTQFDRLREQWWSDGGENARRGGMDWGPYYDVHSLGKSLLARADLRHSLTTYYHRLLANAPSLKDARDLTAALLALYAPARQDKTGLKDDTEVLGGTPETDDLLNVVTPLTVEISENLATLIENEDKDIRTSSTFALDDIKNLPSLASKLRVRREHSRPIDGYLADRLSLVAPASLASYKSAVSDPMPLQMALLQVLDQIVGGFSIYDAQRFRDIDLRLVTKQLLAQKPHGGDLRLLNAMLLEDAYPEELLRNAVGRYAGPVRRRIEEEFGVRIPGIRVRSSPELQENGYRLLIHEQVVAGGSCSDQRLEQVFLHLETVVAANLVEFVGHQEAQNYLERNKLVVPTVEDISEKEHYSHMDPLTSVLRALVTERVPLTEPKAIYEVFRSGWKQGLAIATIVERVRRIPCVQARLWGNDGKHAYMLLPSSLERLLAGVTRTVDQSDYLVMEGSQRTRILAIIGAAIAGIERPALIARRQVNRALVRQLIAPRYSDVPVLSVAEIRSRAEQIVEMAEFDHQVIKL